MIKCKKKKQSDFYSKKGYRRYSYAKEKKMVYGKVSVMMI